MYDYERRKTAMGHGTPSKAKGKGGPGKQRVDWVNQLKKNHKPKSLEDEDAVRHLNTEAAQFDKFEKRFEDGPTESLRRTLQTAFKVYNRKLKEVFGEAAQEKAPEWELPKAKSKRQKIEHELSRDAEREIEEKHGVVSDVQLDEWYAENEDRAIYFVDTEKAELSVEIDRDTGEIKHIEVTKDLEEDDYAAGRKKRR